MTQVVATIYTALATAAGGAPALQVANGVIRDAIRDGAVDDPLAIILLSALADEDTESMMSSDEPRAA